MKGLEIVVVVLTAVLALTWAARRFGISEPVSLLLGGVLIGLIPEFRHVRLPPDLVLLLFLPPLLYAELLTISLHQIRANLRVIVLLAVGLVLVTVVSVAGTAGGLGLAWPMAFVLGAVLAPTDATAVARVAAGMPRRMLTTMRAESLVNDGTALVVFAVAVRAAVGEHSFTWGDTLWRFVASYAGGIAIGAAGAYLVIAVRRRLRDPAIESGLSVLTPFAVYLPAELADVSGVLAVVVCGVILSRASPLLIRATSRVQAFAFWDVATFLLNGSLFVLLGMQLPDAVLGLRSLGLRQALFLAAAVSAAVIVTRLVYMHSIPYLIRALDRRPQQRERRIGARQRWPLAWGGVRGAVSLAAALAVPVHAADGSRLAGRDVIVFVTAVVILVTILLQGQTLPTVIRWSRLPEDRAEYDEELLARQRILDSAREELSGRAAGIGAPQEVVDRLAQELDDHADRLRVEEEPEHEHTEDELRQALISVQRTTLVDLRDAHLIDDAVLRLVQETLDTEETRLEQRAAAVRAAHERAAAAGDGPDRPGRSGPERGRGGPEDP